MVVLFVLNLTVPLTTAAEWDLLLSFPDIPMTTKMPTPWCPASAHENRARALFTAQRRLDGGICRDCETRSDRREDRQWRVDGSEMAGRVETMCVTGSPRFPNVTSVIDPRRPCFILRASFPRFVVLYGENSPGLPQVSGSCDRLCFFFSSFRSGAYSLRFSGACLARSGGPKCGDCQCIASGIKLCAFSSF